jgi:hypothetical protein
MVIYFHLLLFL